MSIVAKMIGAPLADIGADCADCACLTTHSIVFDKDWFGYFPFTVVASPSTDTVYRTFTCHVEYTFTTDPPDWWDGVYVVNLSVTFNRYSGWPLLSYTYTKDGVPQSGEPFWYNTPDTSKDPTTATTGPTATSAIWDDERDVVFGLTVSHLVSSEEWTLSDPYTLADVESDVDVLYDTYDLYEPDLDFSTYAGWTVRYDSYSWYAPDATHPVWESGFLFPQYRSTYDSVVAALDPDPNTTIVEVDGGAWGGFAAANHVGKIYAYWFVCYWQKSRSMSIVTVPYPNYCKQSVGTGGHASGWTPPADVCEMVVPDFESRILIEPEYNATMGMAWYVPEESYRLVSTTVQANYVLTGGGCPCIAE